MDEVILHAVSNVGVPAVICLYTLIEVKKSLEKLTDAFNRWCDLFDRRINDLENDVRALQREKF